MKRILVIDDDDAFRKMLKNALKEAEYEVTEAPDGKVGYQLYREQPSDLIITDIFMPKKDGLTTISDLKKEFPNVKIIAISGGDWPDPIIEAETILRIAQKTEGVHTFTKPFKIQHLLKTIEELLNTTN